VDETEAGGEGERVVFGKKKMRDGGSMVVLKPR
jgi:hypothetical protein